MLGTGALLVACVACGQNEEIGFGGQPPVSAPAEELPVESSPIEGTAPGAGMGAPVPPPNGTQVAPAKVDATKLPEGYPDVVWTEGDGTVIGAFGQAGGCIQATGAVTEQSATQVTFVVTETNSGGDVCTMEILFPPLTAKLDAPLGDRTVVLERTQAGPR